MENNNELERFENWKQKENIILLILTSYSFGMMVVSLILGWPLYIPPVICAGLLTAWIMCFQKYRDFKFRANVLAFISLLDFTMYAVRAGSLFDLLTPLAAVAILLGITALPEVLRWVNLDTAFLCLYHGFYLKTVPLKTDLDKCRACLILVSIILIEGVTYILMKNQQKMLMQMQRIIDELKEAENSRSNFLSNVSHEIRTPINAISGFSELLLMEEMPQRSREEIQDIQKAGRNLQRIVNDILDFTELQKEKVSLVNEPYDLTATIEDVMKMAAAEIGDRKIELLSECDEKVPRRLCGDEQKLRRVITNLMDNAVKFTKEGSIRLTVSCRFETYGINLIVRVQDTGMGIKEEHLEKLLSSFQQIDTRKSREKNGIGLGLAISNVIIQSMGGFLKIESIWEQGTTIQFVVPQKVPDQITAKKEKEVISFTASEASVLVVDDNQMNLKVVKGLLRPYKIQVMTAESGKEALEKIEQYTYDFLFMDHMMPEMDGVETLHRIRQKPGEYFQTVPVIALTANVVGGAREMFLQEGFQDFVSKPIELPVLERVLFKFIPDLKKRKGTEDTYEELEIKEPFPVIKGVDTELGIKYAGGSQEDYKDIIRVYCSTGRKKQKEIQECYEAHDWKNYRILVHAVKSTSQSIGACSLSKQAKKLEEAAESGQTDAILKSHGQMMDDYGMIMEELEKKILDHPQKAAGEEKGIAISKEELLLKLGELQESVRTFEVENAIPVLQQLSRYQYKEHTLSEVMQHIKEQVDQYDFLAAEEQIKELKKEVK